MTGRPDKPFDQARFIGFYGLAQQDGIDLHESEGALTLQVMDIDPGTGRDLASHLPCGMVPLPWQVPHRQDLAFGESRDTRCCKHA